MAADKKTGRGCSTVVERSYTLEVVGSNSAMCGPFFFSSLSYQYCVNLSPSQTSNTTDFPVKICLAVQLEAKQALYARIEQKQNLQKSVFCCPSFAAKEASKTAPKPVLSVK